ncbi:hypothetical protein J6590_068782 [Homalodisca vitripennis]|nr:hypothetical protein J6590_068782 [Homalodisca vitripennis]
MKRHPKNCCGQVLDTTFLLANIRCQEKWRLRQRACPLAPSNAPFLITYIGKDWWSCWHRQTRHSSLSTARHEDWVVGPAGTVKRAIPHYLQLGMKTGRSCWHRQTRHSSLPTARHEDWVVGPAGTVKRAIPHYLQLGMKTGRSCWHRQTRHSSLPTPAKTGVGPAGTVNAHHYLQLGMKTGRSAGTSNAPFITTKTPTKQPPKR